MNNFFKNQHLLFLRSQKRILLHIVYNHKSKAFSSLTHFPKSYHKFDLLPRSPVIFTSFRFMMSSRCLHAGRAVYFGLQALTNDNVMKTSKQNTHEEIAKGLGKYALDYTQGIPQQKEAFMTHLMVKKFKTEHIYASLKDIIPCLTYNEMLVDSRVLKEIPVFLELYLKYTEDILNIHLTGDECNAYLGFKKQTNPDLLVTIKTNEDNFKTKVISLDEKGGMGMFDKSTQGSLGLIAHDSHYKNIQVTSKEITGETLIKYNQKRLNGIQDGLKYDKLDIKPYLPIFNKYRPILNEALDKYPTDFPKVITLHDTIQKELWSQIQCHPDYNRSVSLLFIKK